MRVLGIAAHPSDPFPNIGGTLAKHVKRGDEVVLLTLTYGLEVHTEKYVGKSQEELKGIVRGLSLEAAGILGISDYRFLDFGDTPLVSSREKLIEVGEAIRDIQPDIIISAHYPFREDQGDGDHGEAARMVERAFRLSARQHVGKKPFQARALWFSGTDYFYLSRPVHTIPDTFVDITDTIEQKIQACLTTWALSPEQGEPWAAACRATHRHLGAPLGLHYAEIFESPRLKQVAVEYLGY